jgi:hypothetical protein
MLGMERRDILTLKAIDGSARMSVEATSILTHTPLFHIDICILWLR